MANRRGTNLDAVVGGFARDPLLEHFVAPFPDLLAEAGGDLEASFAQVARLMGRGRRVRTKGAAAQSTLRAIAERGPEGWVRELASRYVR